MPKDNTKLKSGMVYHRGKFQQLAIEGFNIQLTRGVGMQYFYDGSGPALIDDTKIFYKGHPVFDNYPVYQMRSGPFDDFKSEPVETFGWEMKWESLLNGLDVGLGRRKI